MLALLYELINGTTVLVFFVTLLLIWVISTSLGQGRKLPGPFKFPVLGNFPQLALSSKSMLSMVDAYAAQYGPLVSVKFGALEVVFITDEKVMQEAFVKKADSFSNRPRRVVSTLKLFEQETGAGLITNDGPAWKELRRISVTAMRDFGVGKKSLEEKVMEEVRVLLEYLDREQGKPVVIPQYLRKATSNVICNVVFGNRFDFDNPTFIELLERVDAAFAINPVFNVYSFFPVLKFIPYISQKPYTFIKSFKTTMEYVKELTSEHEKTFDPDNIRDFVDMLIDLRTKNKGNRHFSDSNLVRVIVDLFTAGSDSTATSLYWALLFVTAYPEVQTKCHEEIDRVVGRGRPVSLTDKADLKYVQATLLETLRLGKIAPFTVPHCTSEDVELGSCVIPKDTVVMANLGWMHSDPRKWNEPNSFRPERFLNEKGDLVHRERVVNFSVGPRSCIGELLAKMELQLFFPSILQRFRVKAVPGQKVDLTPEFGLTLHGIPQGLIFEPR